MKSNDLITVDPEILGGTPVIAPSPDIFTSFAFGARKRNVTVRSGWTSGDTSGEESRRAGVFTGGVLVGSNACAWSWVITSKAAKESVVFFIMDETN